MMYAVLLVLCEWCGDHRDLRVLTHSFPTRRSSYRQRYYRDGGHGNYHGNITDHYDIRTGRWFRSDVEQVPDGRIMGTYFGWGRGYNYAPWAIHTYKWNLFYNPLTKHQQRRVFHTPNYPVGGNVNDYDPDQGKWAERPPTVSLVGHVIPGTTEGVLSAKGW